MATCKLLGLQETLAQTKITILLLLVSSGHDEICTNKAGKQKPQGSGLTLLSQISLPLTSSYFLLHSVHCFPDTARALLQAAFRA